MEGRGLKVTGSSSGSPKGKGKGKGESPEATTALASLSTGDPSSLLLDPAFGEEGGLALDSYSNVTLSPGVKKRLGRLVGSLDLGGVAGSSLICRGEGGCPFKDRCPITISNLEGDDGGVISQYPLGKQCLVESNFITQKFLGYLQEFDGGGEGGGAASSPTLRSLLSKLVEIDLYDFRMSLILSGAVSKEAATLLIEQTVAVTKDEEEVTQLQAHPAWAIKDRLFRERMELLNALEATPRRRTWRAIALKQKPLDNLATRQRILLERMEELKGLITAGGEGTEGGVMGGG